MFNMKKESFTIKVIIVLLTIILISTSVFSQISRNAEIIVNTDQQQYYPGETVYITGRMEENGTGVPLSTFCVTVFDPDGNISSGICGITDSQGNFSYDYTLFGDAKLGTYEVFVESYQFYINISIYFEVVSTIIEVDAHGPYEGTAGEPVSFFGNATGGKNPYTWHWNFGDDETSDEQNPDHTYTAPGEYIATLTVTDKEEYQGNDTAFVTVNASDNQPPYPLGPPSGPSEGDVGVEYTFCVEFDDPEGDTIYVMWDWGDGTFSEWLGPFNSGEEVCASHIWTAGGDYEVRVKAKDEHGAESNWSEPLLFHVKAPILEVEISGGLGLTITIKNIGDGDAHNVTWYFSIYGGILGRINIEEEGLISMLPAGGEESIVLRKLLFGLGSIEITIEVGADFVNTVTATTLAFVIGPFIIIG